MQATLKCIDGKVIALFEDGSVYSVDVLRWLHHRQTIWLSMREAQSKKAEWRRKHMVSRDMPNSRAARADYSDSGKAVERMLAAIDGPKRRLTEAEKNRAIVNAAVYIANVLGYEYQSPGYMQILIIVSTVALYLNDARAVLMKQFNLTYNAYIKRLTKYSKILEKRQREGGYEKS